MRSAWLRLLLVGLLWCALLPAGMAAANSAGPRNLPGLTAGPIIPRQDTAVRVESEDLRFVVASDLRTARVSATYAMANSTTAANDTDIAFVLVERPQGRVPLDPLVTVDGAPVAVQTTTDAEFFAPLVAGWVDQHPAVKAELARLAALRTPDSSNYTPAKAVGLIGLLKAAGVTIRQEDAYWLVQYAHHQGREEVVHAALLLIPEQVRTVYRSWSPWVQAQYDGHGSGAPATWLIFHVDFPPGAARQVAVSYTHTAAVEKKGQNPLYTYEYLLSPARSWAGFGTLDIAVDLPAETSLKTSFPLRRSAEGYGARLAGLPKGELLFTVRSQQGTVWGMDPTVVAWLPYLGVMALFGGLTGWVLGRRRLSVGGTAFGAGLANAVWMVLLWQVWQPRGPYTGFGIIGGWLQALAVATVSSIVVSLVVATRRRRERP